MVARFVLQFINLRISMGSYNENICWDRHVCFTIRGSNLQIQDLEEPGVGRGWAALDIMKCDWLSTDKRLGRSLCCLSTCPLSATRTPLTDNICYQLPATIATKPLTCAYRTVDYSVVSVVRLRQCGSQQLQNFK